LRNNESNPHPKPEISPTTYLQLGKIYTNEEHLLQQLTMAESQIDSLRSTLTWHGTKNPNGDPHYQVDVWAYKGIQRRGSYLLRWRCSICHYIFSMAQESNSTIDEVEQKLRNEHEVEVLEDLLPLPLNNLMTNLLQYPFPNTADEPSPASNYF
jgi:hypothetical protein